MIVRVAAAGETMMIALPLPAVAAVTDRRVKTEIGQRRTKVMTGRTGDGHETTGSVTGTEVLTVTVIERQLLTPTTLTGTVIRGDR